MQLGCPHLQHRRQRAASTATSSQLSAKPAALPATMKRRAGGCHLTWFCWLVFIASSATYGLHASEIHHAAQNQEVLQKWCRGLRLIIIFSLFCFFPFPLFIWMQRSGLASSSSVHWFLWAPWHQQPPQKKAKLLQDRGRSTSLPEKTR